MKKYISPLLVLLGCSCGGVMGLFSGNLLAAGLDPQDLVLIRNLGSLICLTVFFLLFDRSIFRIELRHLPYFFGSGVVGILMFTLLYFSCQQHCSISLAAILLYTSPAFVILISRVLFRDPITKRKLAALVLALLGAAFASGLLSGQLSGTPKGILLGLIGGFFYSFYTIFSSMGLKHYKPLTVTYYTFVFAGLGSLLMTDALQVTSLLTTDRKLVLFAFGMVLISTVLSYILYVTGLAGVDSGKASILGCIEPVVAAFTGIIAFGEPITLGVVLGLGCILGCVYILR